MFKYLRLCKIFCVLVSLFFFMGCKEEPPTSPPKSKVIRKKITGRPAKPKETVVAAVIQNKDDSKTEVKQPVEGKKEIIVADAEKKKTAESATPEKTVSSSEKAKPDEKTGIAEVSNKDDGKTKVEQPVEVKKEITAADVEKKKTAESTPLEKTAPSSDEKIKPDEKTEIVDASSSEQLKSEESSPDVKKPDSEFDSILDITVNSESDKYLAYNPKGKTDPFAPLFKEDAKEDEKNKQASNESDIPKEPPRPLTPLEKLDLGQLKLVGIISAESGNKALVEEASGKGYIIIKGTYIGINSGKVVDILKDRIIVEEEDKDMLGQITFRKRELKFQAEGNLDGGLSLTVDYYRREIGLK